MKMKKNKILCVENRRWLLYLYNINTLNKSRRTRRFFFSSSSLWKKEKEKKKNIVVCFSEKVSAVFFFSFLLGFPFAFVFLSPFVFFFAVCFFLLPAIRFSLLRFLRFFLLSFFSLLRCFLAVPFLRLWCFICFFRFAGFLFLSPLLFLYNNRLKLLLLPSIAR